MFLYPWKPLFSLFASIRRYLNDQNLKINTDKKKIPRGFSFEEIEISEQIDRLKTSPKLGFAATSTSSSRFLHS